VTTIWRTAIKLGYVILYVPDVAQSVAFYEKAFGLASRFIHESGQYAEMETGATALAFASEDMAAANGHTFRRNRLEDQAAGAEVALVTDDVRQGFTRAVAAGAVAVLQPTEKPWGQVVSYVRDPNGFLVEICSAVA
jgi:catechol 2,3-dioxygenase-like lactoylglutathione lyase family enzyme